jgi:hypothetical protein
MTDPPSEPAPYRAGGAISAGGRRGLETGTPKAHVRGHQESAHPGRLENACVSPKGYAGDLCLGALRLGQEKAKREKNVRSRRYE